MKEWVKSLLKGMIKGKDISDDLSASTEVTLAIKMKSDTIARLFFDKNSKEFCLVYTNKFIESGLTPFHESTSSSNILVDTDTVYRSKTLWYSFALRIPNPDRRDYETALLEAGLKGDESPLEILGKLSNYSISKPWKFEVLDNGKKDVA